MTKWVSASCLTVVLAWLALPGHAWARPTYPSLVPNGTNIGCVTCHNNSGGGDGTGVEGPGSGAGCAPAGMPCLNPFGLQFQANGFVWNATLAGMNADGDSWTNGQELLNPSGSWVTGNANPTPTAEATLPGYSPFYCGTWSRACHMNDCLLSYDNCDTSPAATCNDVNPTFTCTCPTGSTGTGVGSSGCTDTNECSPGNPCLEDSGYGNLCFNASPRYDCSCASGWSVGFDGTYSETCVDNNECSTGNPCLEDTVGGNSCANAPGRWNCTCGAAGYTLTGDGGASETCSNINECTSGNPCNEDSFGTNACLDATPRYNCTCNAGYTLMNDGTFSETCADVDECATPGRCGPGTCSNSVGTFSCTCNAGYTFNGTTCVNINECSTMPGVCGAGGTCMDLTPLYTCTCPVGYSFNGTTCALTDACNANLDDCAPVATCTPIGTMSWSCACPSGYTGNGRVPPPASDTGCTDVNECSAGTPCGVGTCANTAGAYTCSCPTGYAAPPSGGTCVDIDECLAAPCGVGSCLNRIGSYSCTCPAGYTAPAIRGTCTDVDECLTPTTCGASTGNGTCTNQTGAYACSCATGYGPVGSGLTLTCANVNECVVSPPCGVGSCADLTGSYRCTCPAGYSGPSMGGTCDDVNECVDTALCNQVIGYGTCINTTGAFDCACATGFVTSGSGTGLTCVNVDECAANTDDCDPHANCTDDVADFGTAGWTCTCQTGWQGPGNLCEDFDECTDAAANDCSPLATCVNEVGAYGCDCNDGYEGNGFSCVDIDDCGSMPCGVNEICINQLGAPRTCECAPGSVHNPEPDGPCVSSCGNGVRVEGEECDDGNTADDDGCSAICDVEHGWVCFEPSTGTSRPSACAYTCGDGAVDPLSGEECDDGVENSDTAVDACRERCVSAFCGDGVADEGEECDDGDLRSDHRPDACRRDCREAFCGDGVLDRDEYCDEGTGTELPTGSCTAGCFPDAGGADAGVGAEATPPTDGGCACHAAAPSRAPLLTLGLGLFVSLLVVRRRR